MISLEAKNYAIAVFANDYAHEVAQLREPSPSTVRKTTRRSKQKSPSTHNVIEVSLSRSLSP